MTRATEDGYTLIELIVALLLASLVGTAVTGGLQFGTRIWERSDSRIEESRDIATAQTVLRSLLASAIPRRKGGFVTFRGERGSLSFDASTLPALGSHGLVRMDIVLDHDVAESSLKLVATSLIDSRAHRSAVLMERLSDARFSYLDASGKLPVWLAAWRDRDRLPDAVRLDSGGSWPVLVMRLPIAQDADCAFDPVSTSCRRS
jgi:prepilin-type N-terminal cleavage/methylation domain-containing protein